MHTVVWRLLNIQTLERMGGLTSHCAAECRLSELNSVTQKDELKFCFK